MALLDVRALTVVYTTGAGQLRAVDGVNLALEKGHHLGLIGESGSGKSTIGRALMRVLPRNGRVESGQAWFSGADLLTLGEREMRQVRWRGISMVPQASLDALDPVYRVGDQLVETLRLRGGLDRSSARKRAGELFALVGLTRDRLDQYPHEFSGGMRQRAIIAMALALDPELLIADEPVTALDVIVQRQVLEILHDLQERLHLSVIMITHDVAVVAETCDEVAVMYAGKIIERASIAAFFERPFHPYTLGLQNAYPTISAPDRTLISIEGYPPDLVRPTSGCRFNTRCPFAIDTCFVTEPPLIEVEPGHTAACHRWPDVEQLRARAAEPLTWQNVA
jgi:peptide/nickel transport system ATP-binding protein